MSGRTKTWDNFFSLFLGVLTTARGNRAEDEMGGGTGELRSELQDPQAKGGEDGHGSRSGKQAVDVVPSH